MRTTHAPAADPAALDSIDLTLRRFEDDWRRGRPDLDRHRHAPISVLAALVKADLRCRFDRGERPAAAEYLDRFPNLSGASDRVLSLVYEEYCLQEEYGGRPDTADFCARYAPWADSLESQLRYHRVLSQVAGSPPPKAPIFPGLGDHFGPFLILKELGRGGAGRVYLARDESLGNREVALKISHDRGNEPSIMGRLEHPHIVPVHSVVRLPDGAKLRGLCMAYRPGLPLDDLIQKVDPASRPVGALAIKKALRGSAAEASVGGSGWETFPDRGTYAEGVAWLIAVLAEALAYAHGRQIFHRDVKPANVLLTYREGPQLLDFNLSHDPHSAAEADDAIRGGTLPYMAPEQLEAFLDPARWGDVAEPADLYSLGLMLRELLNGEAPDLPDPTLPLPRAIRALLDRRADFRPEIRKRNPTIPHALDAIAERCLAFNPATRYPNAAALADDLRRFLDRRPLKGAENRSTREVASNWLSRRKPSMFLAAVVLLCGIGVAMFGPSGTIGARPSRVDQRPEFQRAANDLDAGRIASALERLNRQGAESWDSPAAVFLNAAAHARAGQTREAFDALERFWSLPRAEESLVVWAQSRPGFASHVEKVGREVLTPGASDATRDRVERTFKMALRLDPGTLRAREGLAVVEESRGHHAAALEILNGVIQSLGKPATEPQRLRLMTSLMTRARVSVRWAGSIPRPSNAENLLAEALTDLDRAEKLPDPNDDATRFQIRYIRCEATLDQAENAAQSRRHGDAAEFLQRAERLLATLETRSTGPVLARETVLKDHLRAELPRIKALILVEEDRHGDSS